MLPVVTLTINPAVDISAAVERVMPIHKLRCHDSRRDPGGGGINVARVVHQAGGKGTWPFIRPAVAPAAR